MTNIYDLLPLGFYLVKDLFEFSGCQAKVIPSYKCIDSANNKTPDADFAKKMCISHESAQKLFDLNNHLLDQNKLAFFNIRYIDIKTACEIRSRFFAGRTDIHLIGVGLSLKMQDSLQQMPEYHEVVFPPGGHFLGFDLYEADCLDTEKFNCTFGCPFRHCDLESKVSISLGLRLNKYGFYSDASDAEKAASHINDNKLGEPVFYVPFGIVDFDTYFDDRCI